MEPDKTKKSEIDAEPNGERRRATDPSEASRQETGLFREIVQIEADLQRELPPQIIELVAREKLKLRERNARQHSKRQVELLAANMQKFGFVGAVITDEFDNVLAGHGRLAAADLIGLRQIPRIRLCNLDEASKAAFALADNRLAELSGWDDEILKLELRELESLADFDLEVTGFDTVDLDRLLGPEPNPYADPDDNIPELRDELPAVSRRGDLWILGDHHAFCGDSLDIDDCSRVLSGDEVVQVFADPPYNLQIRGNVSSKDFREFEKGSGEYSPAEFTDFLSKALANASKMSRDGAIFHVFMDWRHLREMLSAIDAAGLRLMNLCVWAKSSAGMGSFYRSQHELAFVLKKGTAPHINNFGLGARGRNRSNVWRYPSVVHGARRGISDPENGHPTPKPVAAVIDALKDCSKRGDVIFDPFSGSGTTVVAAERVGRRARLIEIDPHYVDLIVRRWQLLTGRSATLAGDGRSFAEIEEARARPE
jgi:DNA modification methylase